MITFAPSASKTISDTPSSVISPEFVARLTAASPTVRLSAAILELVYELNWEAFTYLVVPLSSIKNLSVSAIVIPVPSDAPSI